MHMLNKFPLLTIALRSKKESGHSEMCIWGKNNFIFLIFFEKCLVR